MQLFNTIKITITVNYPKSAAMGFSKGLQNEFETAVVNEPSVFEPLKFYCTLNNNFLVSLDFQEVGKTYY